MATLTFASCDSNDDVKDKEPKSLFNGTWITETTDVVSITSGDVIKTVPVSNIIKISNKKAQITEGFFDVEDAKWDYNEDTNTLTVIAEDYTIDYTVDIIDKTHIDLSTTDWDRQAKYVRHYTKYTGKVPTASCYFYSAWDMYKVEEYDANGLKETIPCSYTYWFEAENELIVLRSSRFEGSWTYDINTRAMTLSIGGAPLVGKAEVIDDLNFKFAQEYSDGTKAVRYFKRITEM